MQTKYGSALPQSKLRRTDAEAIRVRNSMGVPRWWLAMDYGVHIRTIDKVCTFETWFHVRGQ